MFRRRVNCVFDACYINLTQAEENLPILGLINTPSCGLGPGMGPHLSPLIGASLASFTIDSFSGNEHQQNNGKFIFWTFVIRVKKGNCGVYNIICWFRRVFISCKCMYFTQVIMILKLLIFTRRYYFRNYWLEEGISGITAWPKVLFQKLLSGRSYYFRNYWLKEGIISGITN